MMLLTSTDWLLIFLATSYATYAIADNDGPLHIFRHIRSLIEWIVDQVLERGWQSLAQVVESFLDLMDCYVCLSFWMALVMVYVVTGQWLIIHALAVAGLYVGMRKFFDAMVSIIALPDSPPLPLPQAIGEGNKSTGADR